MSNRITEAQFKTESPAFAKPLLWAVVFVVFKILSNDIKKSWK